MEIGIEDLILIPGGIRDMRGIGGNHDRPFKKPLPAAANRVELESVPGTGRGKFVQVTDITLISHRGPEGTGNMICIRLGHRHRGHRLGIAVIVKFENIHPVRRGIVDIIRAGGPDTAVAISGIPLVHHGIFIEIGSGIQVVFDPPQGAVAAKVIAGSIPAVKRSGQTDHPLVDAPVTIHQQGIGINCCGAGDHKPGAIFQEGVGIVFRAGPPAIGVHIIYLKRDAAGKDVVAGHCVRGDAIVVQFDHRPAPTGIVNARRIPGAVDPEAAVLAVPADACRQNDLGKLGRRLVGGIGRGQAESGEGVVEILAGFIGPIHPVAAGGRLNPFGKVDPVQGIPEAMVQGG